MDLCRWTFVLGLSAVLCACKSPGSFGVSDGLGGTVLGNVGASTPDPTLPTPVISPIVIAPLPAPAPSPVITPVVPDYPLLWEAARAEGKAWTTAVYQVIENEVATDLMTGADDVADFCPKYASFTNHQRSNFWGLLVSAMVKFESGFDPLSRMAEPSLGKDTVTGLTIESEGLLQLSYQDASYYSFCDFDWSADRNLAVKDPNKTILNAQKNLSCGIKILARQIHNHGVIAAKSGAYWSVLIPGGTYTQIPQIQAITSRMTGCQ